MELQVAGALSFRLAQQEHWEQSTAVSDGRQPKVDPDGADLEQFVEQFRIYRLREVYARIDGRMATGTQRLVKRLAADGFWHSDLIVDSYQHPGCAPVAVVHELGPTGAGSSKPGVAA